MVNPNVKRKVNPTDDDIEIIDSGEFKIYKYRGLKFEESALKTNGFKLRQTSKVHIAPQCEDEKPIFDTMNTIWDKKHFETARKPIVIGKLKGPEKHYGNNTPRILDMPIKFPGDLYFKVPTEFRNCRGILQRVLNAEASLNPRFSEYYAYLTIDNSWVKKGECQRNGGFHVDGFQGARIKPKVMIDRSYIVASHDTPLFCPNSFSVGDLDEARHNFFSVFDEDINEQGLELWFSDPYEICLMDAYTVHSAIASTFNGTRRFLRVTFSVRQFDRLGNTHNPMYKYNWKMVPRDTAKHLI